MTDFSVYRRDEGGRVFVGLWVDAENESEVIEALREKLGVVDASVGECVDHGCVYVLFVADDLIEGYEIESTHDRARFTNCGQCGLLRFPFSAGICEWCYLTYKTDAGRCASCGEDGKELRRSRTIPPYWYVRCHSCGRDWDVGLVVNPEYTIP